LALLDGIAVTIYLDGYNENGRSWPQTIRLSLNQVGALGMKSWAVEQSTDPAQGMVTLRATDGFPVCLSIPREQQSELGEVLVASYELLLETCGHEGPNPRPRHRWHRARPSL
jgi:hypothetical protein